MEWRVQTQKAKRRGICRTKTLQGNPEDTHCFREKSGWEKQLQLQSVRGFRE